MIRDAARSTRGRIVVGAVVAFLLWKLALVLLAPAKVMPGFTPNARGQVNVLVTLRCTPERFHVLEFQKHGRVSGTENDTIEVRGVAHAGLNALAQPYWVKSVAPLRTE
ncbi:MAG TPA: hypothetical protein VHM00_17905 [Caldimonas sp.]|nr:hypothetical protein [Caldimonas sp.]HEX2542942.1 hypothetical protein [Caldimonas sp.]